MSIKYIADRGYTDVELHRHVDKGEELDKIYNDANIKLTKERINYLVEERKLYIAKVEEKEVEVEADAEDKKENKEDVKKKTTKTSKAKDKSVKKE